MLCINYSADMEKFIKSSPEIFVKETTRQKARLLLFKNI